MNVLTKHLTSVGSDGYLLDDSLNTHIRTNGQTFLSIHVENAATQPSDSLDGYVWEALGILDSGLGRVADHSHWFILIDDTGASTHEVNGTAKHFDVSNCSRVRVRVISNLSYGTITFEAWAKGGAGVT